MITTFFPSIFEYCEEKKKKKGRKIPSCPAGIRLPSVRRKRKGEKRGKEEKKKGGKGPRGVLPRPGREIKRGREGEKKRNTRGLGSPIEALPHFREKRKGKKGDEEKKRREG